MSFVCFSLFCIAISFVYLWYSNRYKYWKKKGVKGPKPALIVGNMCQLFTKNSLGMQFQDLYERTKHLPFAGIYLFHRPGLLVNDLNLIENIFVKDFEHFTDRGLDFDKTTHHLHSGSGRDWYELMIKLASTWSNLKEMLQIMEECSENMKVHLDKLATHEINVDIREILAKYTTDVIVNCSFGMESDSFKDPKIRYTSKDIFQFSFKNKIVLTTALFAPDIQRFFNGRTINDGLAQFFVEKMEQIVKCSEENGVEVNDALQSLINLKNSDRLTLLDITSLAFVGYETTLSTFSFLFFELAKNRHVQQKLVEEIDQTLTANDNKITCETLNSMTYLNQILDETLRKYPPIPVLLRRCTKDYTIPDTDILIEKGTPIYVSSLGIHKNPEHYENPETFDPERFSTDNKRKGNNFEFIPFGEGPRTCIGNKFAYMQIGIALVTILRDFHVDITGDCVLKVVKDSLLLAPNILKLKFTHRKKHQ